MGFFNVGLFCEEASKLTILDNPCIVKFMGYSTNNGALVLLTEYMCCGPINKVLKRRRTSTNDKLKYCTQVAEGMVYLASNSVRFRRLYSFLCPIQPLVVTVAGTVAMSMQLSVEL